MKTITNTTHEKIFSYKWDYNPTVLKEYAVSLLVMVKQTSHKYKENAMYVKAYTHQSAAEQARDIYMSNPYNKENRVVIEARPVPIFIIDNI